MSYELRSISKSGIDEAISKAELYRYLNEPEETESICHDILAIEPGHQIALRMLGMAITDQFDGSGGDRFAGGIEDLPCSARGLGLFAFVLDNRAESQRG